MNTLAPSEKHLEDYLWAHPEALGMCGIPPQYGPDQPMYDFAFRQLRTVSGVMDLVGFSGELCVLELKRATLTSAALAQVLRYIRDMKAMLMRLGHDLAEMPICRPWMNNYIRFERRGLEDWVHGVLIGSGVENENLLIACEACDVEVFVYDFDGSAYQFSRIYADPCWGIQTHPIICDLAFGALGDAVIDHYRPDILEHFRHLPENFSAAEAAEEFVNGIDPVGGAS